MKVIEIVPVAKPRMTQRDRWKKRPVVEQYWSYKDAIRAANIQLPPCYHLHFIIPMPTSWSKKKKRTMAFTPHLQRPDKDNLEKGFLDALFEEDSAIWTGHVSKWWGDTGCIIIEELPVPRFPLFD
jgi:Holliday junction resolvase RusA-like endonuclease